MKNTPLLFILLGALLFCTVSSCREKRKPIGEKAVVTKPQELKLTVTEVIEASLEAAEENNGRVADIMLKSHTIVKQLYEQNSYAPLWTNDSKWKPKSDSLLQAIRQSRSYGLFPEDYYLAQLDTLHQKTVQDTSRENKLDASLWAEADMLLTSAFICLVNDLKIGRLVADSVRQKDTTLTITYYNQQLDSFRQKSTIDFATALEPKHTGYLKLKAALQDFLIKANLRHYTSVSIKDTAQWARQLQKRLREDSIDVLNPADSLELANGIRKWQVLKSIKSDGKISSSLFARLNYTDADKFLRVAITLDRYKILAPMPANYLWVNIPAYRLNVFENDTVVLTSKVVVGKPVTRTPQLTSIISDMITYPLWHIPNSIIVKDILPALKKDPGYLAKKGFSLVDSKHNEIDPFSVDWHKYTNGIPYTVIQGSGDANALGVIKFNFPNKYDVYLHDTNQREFFSRSQRALSHGCVRVQAWDSLSRYLLIKDSAVIGAIPMDSLQTWLVRKEKHVIPLHKRVPLFIRYFTCEGIDGKLAIHDDIYGEDRRLRQTYFATK
ncbi:MAG: L,D-transpeptidase family protein [Flaviaesturariibacter sp.]|nr:L,D-transpeptidase family protein [Flaviaesturariibacter sp.]